MKDREEFLKCWLWLASLCAAVAIVGALCSCKSARMMEAPTTYILRDTVRENKTQRDSVIIRDSIYVDGEKEYREREVRLVRLLTDTLYVARTDSVRVPVPYPVEAKRQENWHDTAFKWLGQAVCIAALLWLMFLYLKRRTR